MAGLSDTGLVIKTQPEIQAELEEIQTQDVSDRLNFQADGVVGQLNGIVSDTAAGLWELARDVYSSWFPNLATGFSLSQLVQLTGTERSAATKSRVTVSVNVDMGTYAVGDLVASVDVRPDDRFINIEAVTNPGPGAADFDVVMEAEVTGPVQAPAASLVIAEPFTGWNTITQATDATPGDNTEVDPDLRLRRENELASGSSTADAIAAAITRELTDEGVDSVKVVVNDLDTTSADGLPPHSFEAIVQGPDSPAPSDDEALAEVIKANKADGIQAYGTSSVNVTDTQGNVLAIGFTRPVAKNVWVEFDLLVDAATYAGDAAVEQAVIDFGLTLDPGEDVSYFRVSCIPFEVAGVLDVVTSGIGFTASVATASLAIALREIAAFDTSRVTVTTTP